MKCNFFSNKLFATLALLSVVLPLLADSKSGTPEPYASFVVEDNAEVSDADRRKAEYVFLESQRKASDGDYASQFELLRYAYRLDPTNTFIAYELGFNMVLMSNLSESRDSLALELMRKHFESSSSDYSEARVYCTILQRTGDRNAAVEAWEKINKRYPNDPDLLFSLAESCRAAGDFQKSLDIYDSIEYSQGKMMELTSRKISVLSMLKDSARAISEAKSLLATAPQSVDYNLLVSDVYDFFACHDSALAYVDKAQLSSPEDGMINVRRALIYNNMGDTVGFDREIYKALTNDELDLFTKRDILYRYSMDLLKDSSERATNLFKVLIDKHPHEYEIHSMFAQFLWERDDFAGCEEQANYAVGLKNDDKEMWRILIAAQIMQSSYESAIESCDAALNYFPGDVDILGMKVSPCMALKRYQDVLECADSALAKLPQDGYDLFAQFYAYKGDAYYGLNDMENTANMYEKSLQYNPDDPMVMNNYAYYLSEGSDNLEKAEDMSYRTVIDSPENPTYLDTYAWILFKKGNYKEALLYIEKAMKFEEGESKELSSHYGDILFMNGKPDEALVQWQKALELDPTDELLQRKVEHKTYFFK